MSNQPWTDAELIQLRVMLVNLQTQLTWGCGNHGCRIYNTMHRNRPMGQATNATCQCDRRHIAQQLNDLKIMVKDATLQPPQLPPP